MKKLLHFGLLAFIGITAFSNRAADLSLPITQGADLAVVNPGNGEGTHFIYRLSVEDASAPPGEYYTVGLGLITTSFARPLRASTAQIDFLAGEQIGSGNQDFRTSGGGNWIAAQYFDEARDFPGANWRYMDVAARDPDRHIRSLRTKTEFFIGFRFTGDAGQHYGWMRFNRPDTNFLTFFQLSGWDYNPLAGEPIGAGQPPVIPVQSAFTGEGQLRLQWPAEVANWVLETSPTLGPDALWEPVPDVVGTEHLLAPPDADRFYRLRRP